MIPRSTLEVVAAMPQAQQAAAIALLAGLNERPGTYLPPRSSEAVDVPVGASAVSLRELSRRSGSSQKAVRLSLAHLQARGAVTAISGRRTHAVYVCVGAMLLQNAPPNADEKTRVEGRGLVTPLKGTLASSPPPPTAPLRSASSPEARRVALAWMCRLAGSCIPVAGSHKGDRSAPVEAELDDPIIKTFADRAKRQSTLPAWSRDLDKLHKRVGSWESIEAVIDFTFDGDRFLAESVIKSPGKLLAKPRDAAHTWFEDVDGRRARGGRNGRRPGIQADLLPVDTDWQVPR